MLQLFANNPVLTWNVLAWVGAAIGGTAYLRSASARANSLARQHAATELQQIRKDVEAEQAALLSVRTQELATARIKLGTIEAQFGAIEELYRRSLVALEGSQIENRALRARLITLEQAALENESLRRRVAEQDAHIERLEKRIDELETPKAA